MNSQRVFERFLFVLYVQNQIKWIFRTKLRKIALYLLTMAKKFDTNPLDPNFPERTKMSDGKTTDLPNSNGATTKFADPAETEEQTRKFSGAEFDAFNSGFGQEGNQPVTYQPKAFYTESSDENKKLSIGSISLPENILMALPYIPFSIIGILAGILELIFIPKSEPKVRYHAAQGLAAQLGIWVVVAVLSFLSFGSDIASTISWIFSIVTTIMLLVFAYKAWKDEPIHIETVQDLTDWLEEKIAPHK